MWSILKKFIVQFTCKIMIQDDKTCLSLAFECDDNVKFSGVLPVEFSEGHTQMIPYFSGRQNEAVPGSLPHWAFLPQIRSNNPVQLFFSFLKTLSVTVVWP